jgi:hypothetical protein
VPVDQLTAFQRGNALDGNSSLFIFLSVPMSFFKGSAGSAKCQNIFHSSVVALAG